MCCEIKTKLALVLLETLFYDLYWHRHTCNIFTTCVYLLIFISMLAVDQLIHTFFIYFTNYMLGTKQSLMQTSHFLIETNMLTSFFDKKTSESNVILSLYNLLHSEERGYFLYILISWIHVFTASDSDFHVDVNIINISTNLIKNNS
ncbi:hypothetical protein ACJX0J_008999 [Zea mays]